MSDIEEPPSKVTKIELETSQPQDETMETADNGQEEWLSEEVLTDEDYNQSLEQDRSQEGNTSQDDSQFSMAENSLDTADQINKLDDHLAEYQQEEHLMEEEETVNDEQQTVMDKHQTETEFHNSKMEGTELNVEEQLTSLENIEGKETGDNKPGEPLTADLGMFLIRKSDGQVDVMTERKDSSEFEPSEKHSDEEDDGNNTDELLRMLGEDNNKSKKAQGSKDGKIQLTSKKGDVESSDSDFEGALVTTTMKVAKRVLMNKKPARKAVPEDMSDSEQSEEENRAMAAAISSKHYQVKKKLNVASKSTAKSSITSRNMSTTKPKTGQVSAQKLASNSNNSITKSSVSKSYNGPSVKKPVTANVSELSPKNSVKPKALVQKMASAVNANKQPTSTPIRSSSRPHKAPVKLIAAPSPPKRTPNQDLMKREAERQTKKEEAEKQIKKEEVEFDSDEIEEEDSKDFLSLMKPERMDEETPSDEESMPSDASFYDELPTSESEGVEDWFALDVRAERAGDYIPLLGHRAFELLGEEKKRVVKKLSTIRESITSLTEKSRDQTKEIENARKALAELDALLIHT